MKKHDPAKMLFLYGMGGVICSAGVILLSGMIGLFSLVGISIFMSTMFSTIYDIALKDMKGEAKIGSAGLVIAIIGGALMPVLQGSILDLGDSGFTDLNILGFISEAKFSFILPLICLAVVATYGKISIKSA